MARAARCSAPFDGGTRLCSLCRLSEAAPGFGKCSRMVAESPAMRALLVRAAPIASTTASVVILGESGAGKEVLARALHANSPRRSRPFVAVNVAALPGELLESELFGHVKGAFTGAVSSRPGLMQAASGGTLFLDEIGDMPLSLQAKILRALQDGEVRPVGDVRSTSVDVRIVCATHRDLRALVSSGGFREDLFYRLNVFTLRVPPLRERVPDILPLARLMLEQEGEPDTKISLPARKLLERHDWPGNVRELGDAMLHGLVLSRGGPIRPEHLPEQIGQPAPRSSLPTGVRLRSLAEVEREHVLGVLEACGGNQVEAAQALGIGRNTLWRKLRTYREEE